MIAVVEIELTEYRVPVMHRLQERLGEQVIVYHGIPAPGSNLRVVQPGQDVGFRHEPLWQRWLLNGRLVVNNPIAALRGPRPRAVIVRHTVRNPVFPMMLRTFHLLRIPVIGWGHGYSHRRTFEPSRRLADRTHLAVVRACDAYVCYSENIREVLSRYVPRQQLFVARNTVDTDRLFDLRRLYERHSRPALRKRLGLEPDLPYLCFIGRLQARKRPHVVLEVCAHLEGTEGIQTGVVFVGEGPLRPELERRAKQLGLSNVAFAGATYGDEAARYLYVSDVMAMPGALGLAAAHSLALGVPVVTQRLGSDLVGHGPEAAYVRDGATGRIAEGGVEAFAAAVSDVLARREEFSRNAVEFAERHLRLDDMVDGFVRAVSYVTG